MLVRHHWANTSQSRLFYSWKYSPCFTNNPTIYMVDLWIAKKKTITMKCTLSNLFWLFAQKLKPIVALYPPDLTFLWVFVVQIKTEYIFKTLNHAKKTGDHWLSTLGLYGSIHVTFSVAPETDCLKWKHKMCCGRWRHVLLSCFNW